MENGLPWPRISIVTTNYNYARFLEETIRTVLLQGYPDLEYIVMDGGSTDGSVEIIRRYSPWLSHWESEKDRGQSHAINKGFSRATGEIVAWLNSDDVYLPGALRAAAEALAGDPGTVLVYGRGRKVDAEGRDIGEMWECRDFDLPEHIIRNQVPQQSAFWRRRLFQEIGRLREDLHYVMDYEFWFRAARAGRLKFIPRPLAAIRIHGAQKTFAPHLRAVREQMRVLGEIRRGPLGAKPELRRALRRGLAAQYRTLGAAYLGRGRRWETFFCYLQSLTWHWEKLAEVGALPRFFVRWASASPPWAMDRGSRTAD